MRHDLEVSVIKPAGSDVVRCRKVSIREKLMQFLFGEMRRMWIIIPCETIDSLSIHEVPEGGKDDESY